MKTKKICELTGLSRKALLFYEEKGLAEHVTREMGSQYEVVQVKRSISV